MHRGNHRTSVFVRSLMLVAAVCLCLTQVVSAAGLKLSGSTSIEGAVESFKIDPTETYVVYSANLPAVASYLFPTPNLYSVRLSGGEPVALTDFGDKIDQSKARVTYEISPDGKWVVLTGNRYGQTIDVFMVPIQGGTDLILLNPTGLDVRSFVISPDSRWVFFSVQGTGFDFYQYHLYRAPLDGSGTVAEIKSPDGSPLMVQRMEVTPDNQRLLFEGGLSDATTWGVYSLPVEDSGSQLVCLTKPMANRWNFFYTVTPDSQFIVYEYMPTTDPYKEGIYTVPVTGPVAENIKVSGTLSPTAYVSTILLDSQGHRLVFAAGDTFTNLRLYSTSLVDDGTELPNPVIELTGSLPTGTQVRPDYVVISPDDTLVAYAVVNEDGLDLYLAPIDGPSSSNVLVSHAASYTSKFFPQFSPDSQRLIFLSHKDNTTDQSDLFSVKTTGLVPGQIPDATRLSLPLAAMPQNGETSVIHPLITQDSQTVYYAAETQAGRTDLFRVPIDGPASTSLNLTSFTTDGAIAANLALAPYQRGLLYTQQIAGSARELFILDPLPYKIYLSTMRR